MKSVDLEEVAGEGGEELKGEEKSCVWVLPSSIKEEEAAGGWGQ